MTTQRRTDNERGTVTASVVILVVAIVAAGGLVIDGGRLMNARREATSVAASAARTAAQELDVDLFETGDTVTLIPTDADSVARQLLIAQGYDNFEITVTGDDVPLTLLAGIAGRTKRVTGVATAALAQQP
jgi:uncharacterized membrane protein